MIKPNTIITIDTTSKSAAVRIDIERMTAANRSKRYLMPCGLDQEQMRQRILAAAKDD